ncbi:MAG TPA: histone deacetylase [Bryobacteraceae bacterium]|jgi:acetoin utilization deacetylase AcuC-like enzyme|nr:histone deacetylase [Bryobacteraceae bacterium]
MTHRTGFLFDPTAKEHNPGMGHPEQPARWDAAMRGLDDLPVTVSEPRAATVDELALCHTRDYIRLAQREVQSGAAILSTGDTDICPRSYEVALHAAGTCLNAVDLVMHGYAKNAFCIVRPPGHHASADRGMGFCLFNNIAVAARYAQRHYGVERVVIADWDVHHGNGTQDIFYRDPSVFFFSTHQSPWYPGTGAANETGAGAGEGTTLNCPFPSGAGRDQILGAFRERLMPRMTEFQPDLILISAGFDSRAGDPLGQFRLTDSDFAELTALMMEIADRSAGGRLISVLEGGYNLDGLEKAVRSHTHSLWSFPLEPRLP